MEGTPESEFFTPSMSFRTIIWPQKIEILTLRILNSFLNAGTGLPFGLGAGVTLRESHAWGLIPPRGTKKGAEVRLLVSRMFVLLLPSKGLRNALGFKKRKTKQTNKNPKPPLQPITYSFLTFILFWKSEEPGSPQINSQLLLISWDQQCRRLRYINWFPSHDTGGAWASWMSLILDCEVHQLVRVKSIN